MEDLRNSLSNVPLEPRNENHLSCKEIKQVIGEKLFGASMSSSKSNEHSNPFVELLELWPTTDIPMNPAMYHKHFILREYHRLDTYLCLTLVRHP